MIYTQWHFSIPYRWTLLDSSDVGIVLFVLDPRMIFVSLGQYYVAEYSSEAVYITHVFVRQTSPGTGH